MEGFSQRFNVNLEWKGTKAFKNRCLIAIDKYIGYSQDYVDCIYSDICSTFGLPGTLDDALNRIGKFKFQNSTLYNRLLKIEINSDRLLFTWLVILEIIFDLKIGNEEELAYTRSDFAFEIAEAIELSGINAMLCEGPDGYKFYPANAELLDQKLIIDILNWMTAYPKSKEQFDNALRLYLKGERTRHVIDSMRLCLELFLKDFFGNTKSLENQLKPIGDYLNEESISPELKNMYPKLLDYYCKYNNEHIKHNDDETIADSEFEFVMYLTGLFIRFFIMIKNSKGRVIG